jgi:ABC-2 type transport system permease protein
MIPIFLKEVADRRFSLLAYGSITLGLIIMYVTMFPTIAHQSQSYTQLFDSLPVGYQKAFGIQAASFTSLEGFLGVEMFSLTWPLLVIILAISRAGGAIAGEIEQGTMRTLLSLSVSRSHIFLAKYLSGVLAVLVLAGLTAAGMIGSVALSDQTISSSRVLTALGLGTGFGLAVFSVGMAVSALLSERGKVYMVMGGLLLAMYIAHVVAGINPNLTWLNQVSAFHYFDGSGVMIGSNVGVAPWLVFAGTILGGFTCGLIGFSRRDVAAS